MKIISWNVNGIRAVERKSELQNLIDKNDPDILCLQEIKAQTIQLEFLEKKFPQFVKFYHPAQKPGYAGTAIWVKKSFVENISNLDFATGFSDFTDAEGRVAHIDFIKNNEKFSIFSIYAPNGGKSEEAWQGKIKFYQDFREFVNTLRKKGRIVIFSGDWNVAHQEIDLFHPKQNEGKIGFHPTERAEFDKYVSQDWIDVFREKYPEKVIYSWWHVISRARTRNVGWRIDYFFTDRSFLPQIKSIEYLNSQMGSDHCPVVMER
jgi:exodeoxyribonuclease-3